MKLAIMQPYFFPYIGYWQLIHATDQIVIYDDVNYIKGGWVNRNRVLINGQPRYITVPLYKASPYKLISEISLLPRQDWRSKLIRTIDITYKKAPKFHEVFPIIEKLIQYKSNNLSEYLVYQLQTLSAFMGINTKFIVSSRCFKNKDLSGQDRILDICIRKNVSKYINLQGGRKLYETESFRNAGIDLQFILMRPIAYMQNNDIFVPFLSIIDVLMVEGFAGITKHLDAFDLVAGP